VVVALEIQYARTAKGAFGSDAVADSVSDADATHTTAGTAVVGAPKSLKQTFSKGPKLSAIEKIFDKNVQDQKGASRRLY
jgi:hypothetical protein